MTGKTGSVTLVGAGCGAADLITLRGLDALRRCDAVVYDDLIDPALLAAAPPQAQRIYMGKRSGKRSAAQDAISLELVRLAQDGKNVVRLKGGDPFVFGRGGEEILALQAAGVSYREVPGITSGIAIPAEFGIPVTHRGVARSFHIITGHTADTTDCLPADLPALAQLHGTLVFLMGLAQLPRITDALRAAGKPAETPAAVLSGGNAPHPAAVRGTLADIAEKVCEAGLLPPAVIVVGEVAALDISPTFALPLQGVHVGLVGTEGFCRRLEAPLQSAGAQSVCLLPMVRRALAPDFDWNVLTDNAPKWVAFTSRNGVELFFAQLQCAGLDVRRLAACRFAVIGRATGDALAHHGILPELCCAEATTAALGAALAGAAAPEEPVYLFGSLHGSPAVPQALEKAGRTCQRVPLYDVAAAPLPAETLAQLAVVQDYLVLGSAGGVRAMHTSLPTLPARCHAVCIGPVSAAAFEALYGTTPLIAAEISAEGIAAAILADCGTQPPAAPYSKANQSHTSL